MKLCACYEYIPILSCQFVYNAKEMNDFQCLKLVNYNMDAFWKKIGLYIH